MEIKCLNSTQILPRPNSKLRSCIFSPDPSHNAIDRARKGRVQREMGRSKKKLIRKRKVHCERRGCEQFSSTKSSLTQNSREAITNAGTLYRLKRHQFHKKLKNDSLQHLQQRSRRSPISHRKARHKTPMKLQSTNKIWYKISKLHKNRTMNIEFSETKTKLSSKTFNKNNNCYYSNEMKLSIILQKLYYENFKFDDIKDYAYKSFSKIKDDEEYIKILKDESKSFVEDIIKSISRVIIKLKHGSKNDLHSINFKRFGPHRKLYVKAVNFLYQHYKVIDIINFEVEKLTSLYLNKNSVSQKNYNCLLHHKNIFTEHIYNDELIHSFIVSLDSFFKKNSFYSKHYPETYSDIVDLFQNLEQSSESLVNDYEYRQKKKREEEDEALQLYQEQQRIKEEILFEEEKRLIEEEQKMVKEQQRKKNKRKRNRKKIRKMKEKAKNCVEYQKLLSIFKESTIKDNRIVVHFTEEELNVFRNMLKL